MYNEKTGLKYLLYFSSVLLRLSISSAWQKYYIVCYYTFLTVYSMTTR